MEAVLKTLEAATVAAQKEQISEEWRVRLLTAASGLVTALQKQEETLMRETFWMGRFLAMRVLQDLSVFEQIVAKGQVTSGELAESSKADQRLIDLMAGCETMAKIPAFLAETGYKNPENQSDGPLQYRYNAQGQDLFQILFARPNLLLAFSAFFEGDSANRPSWVDWFPVQQRLLDDPNRPIPADGPLYVDIAGGRGHDLLAFKRKFAQYPGKYYLFDLPHIVEDRTLDLGDRVERVGFSFFENLVAPASRLYFMKFILHDWSDEKCLAILKNVTAIMKRGYSQLIVEDFILPPTGASLLPTLFDMQMITFLAAMERTEKQWRELLSEAGLVVEGFHLPPGDGTGIIVTSLQ